MNLEKLYKLQKELDKTILENEVKRTGKEIDKDLLLSQTILALQVEVAELANATRCFKHWSTKEAESRERLLDEYADILHFYLSIGNQLGIKAEELFIPEACFKINKKTVMNSFIILSYQVNDLYIETTSIVKRASSMKYQYLSIRDSIEHLGMSLEFDTEELEQAYMKKHKENYRRQEEGY